MRRRALACGIVALAAYVLLLAITVGLRDNHVRPLYDGFAPPSPYRFVHPPPFFAADNQQPASVAASVALRADGSVPIGVATSDAQAILSLPSGAVATHGSDRRVRIAISPHDPAEFAPVPNGLRSNGNAYRVQMTYEPSGTKVTRVVKPGTLLLEIPEVSRQLFKSEDGRRWTDDPARALPPRQLTLSTEFTGPGDYLSATNLPLLPGPASSSSSSSSNAVLIGIGVAALALILGALGFVIARRRRARGA